MTEEPTNITNVWCDVGWHDDDPVYEHRDGKTNDFNVFCITWQQKGQVSAVLLWRCLWWISTWYWIITQSFDYLPVIFKRMENVGFLVVTKYIEFVINELKKIPMTG